MNKKNKMKDVIVDLNNLMEKDEIKNIDQLYKKIGKYDISFCDMSLLQDFVFYTSFLRLR